jgi:RHS repeat-associated protein
MGGNVTPLTRSIWSGMGINPDAMTENMRQGLEEMKSAEQTDIAIHYFHCDHLGTPLALTNQQGQIDWAGKYDAWGNIEEEFNPHEMEQNIRLPGQYYDRETRLYYNRHRYYDSSTGCYINQDPIGLLGGLNLFTYTSNPLKFSDPRGLDAPGVKPCAERIVEAAKALNNNKSYAANGGPATCNLFVGDVLSKAGIKPPQRTRFGIDRGPITAGTWADPNANIPGFKTVSTPQAGDIVAVAHNYVGATGHVAVVTEAGGGSGPFSELSGNTIGANPKVGSHTTGWPWDGEEPVGTPVYHRCID